MSWEKLTENDKKEYIELFKKTYGSYTIISIHKNEEPTLCDEHLRFNKSEELMDYFISKKRIEKIIRIKERLNASR